MNIESVLFDLYFRRSSGPTFKSRESSLSRSWFVYHDTHFVSAVRSRNVYLYGLTALSFLISAPAGAFLLKVTVLKIVYLGDIVGRPGRDVVLSNLSSIRTKYNADVIIINGENSSHGFGITPKQAKEFLAAGADVIVTGNHVYNQKEIIPFLSECKHIIRPLNYPSHCPGYGFCELELSNGHKILITQVLGRLYMEAVDCPVQSLDSLLKNYKLGSTIDAIFVDIHAEATSEKLSLGYYLDGRVSVVAGSHTHVPTSDARILRHGSAYISDVGMCGDYDSVLGFDITEPILRLQRKVSSGRLTPSVGKGSIYGIFVETDDKSGLAQHIEQIVVAK